MSGGYFDYAQYKIDQIADGVEHLVVSNEDKTLNEYGTPRGANYSPEIIAEFQKGLYYLRVAAVYAQRIDYLVSGDDGEESFLARIKKDMSRFEKEPTHLEISDLAISVRAYNVLVSNDIRTIAQLTNLTKSDLMKLINLGRRSANEIIEALSAHNLFLKKE